MTPYNPHQWTSHLFDVEGSMVREILGRVSACVVWSAVIVGLYQYGPDWFDNLAIAETAHALIGPSLGLLLVFRTNASYDRFWEGRKQWGGSQQQGTSRWRLVHVPFQDEASGRACGIQQGIVLGRRRVAGGFHMR